MEKIHPLTTLRFFAAACILVSHGNSPDHFNQHLHLFWFAVSVSFFFVLSGFILSHTSSHGDYRRGVGEFYAARIARVWPAVAFTTLIALWFFSGHIRSITDVLHLLVNLTLLQSWTIFNYSWYYAYNGVTWSVSTEMFFYLLFPFLAVAATMPRRRVLVSLALVGLTAGLALLAWQLGLSVQDSPDHLTAIGLMYIFPPARLLEFWAGILAYQAVLAFNRRYPNNSFAIASFIEVAALVFTGWSLVRFAHLGSLTPLPFNEWVNACGPFLVFALLIAVLSRQAGIVSRILSWRPLVYLGEVSFSLYLVHQLVIRWMFTGYATQAAQQPTLYYVFYWALALGCATLLYELVETPMRNPLRRILTRLFNKHFRLPFPKALTKPQ